MAIGEYVFDGVNESVKKSMKMKSMDGSLSVMRRD